MKIYNKKYKFIETYGLLMLDFLGITIAYALAYLIRFAGQQSPLGKEGVPQVYIFLLLLCPFYSLLADGYKYFNQRGYYKELIEVLKYELTLFIAASTYIYIFRLEQGFSRLMLGYFIIINSCITYIGRIAFRYFLNSYYKRSKNSDKIMVITTQQDIEMVINHIDEDNAWSYEIVSVALMDVCRIGETIRDIPIVADKTNVIEEARQGIIDVVFIYYPDGDKHELEWLVQSLLAMGVMCHNCIENLNISTPYSSIGKFADFPVLTYTMGVIDYRWKLVKKLMDLAGGMIGLIFTAVITPFVAVAIKLDSPGPVFFRQTRVGKNGRRFQIYKFRSMYIDAEKRKSELMQENEMHGPIFKIKDDPRITRVGRFLRKTSIDELPQFWNVVKGDMSLVGTRPPTEEEFGQYNIYYKRRLSITPGLTGMWQVCGRSDITDFDEIVKLDLKYIDEWSMAQDIKILLLTIGALLFGRGAE